jgi:hypothetical protein
MRLAVAASSRDQICSRFVDGLLNHVRGNKIKFCPRDTIPHIDYAAVVAFHTQVEERHAGRFSGPHHAL